MIIALMMEAARTPETSVNLYQTTRNNNPEYSQLHPVAFVQLRSTTLPRGICNNLQQFATI
jgi:hypothetical protein